MFNMEEIVIKVNVPDKFNERFTVALENLVRDSFRRAKFSLAEDILNKSKMTDEEVNELTDEVNESVARRLKQEKNAS